MKPKINPMQQHQFLQMPASSIKEKRNTKQDFHKLLQTEQLKMSKHAEQRLRERNISINNSQWQKIAEQIDKAKQKGITDSLVVLNHAALLVNTKNNTIVTALQREEVSERIFSNINGTILINE